MTASQMRIAETIDAFYGDAGARDGVSRSYKDAVADLDAETIKALDGPYRYAVPKTCPTAPNADTILAQPSWNPSRDSAPTSPKSTNVRSPFPLPTAPPFTNKPPNTGIKKRGHKQTDYDAMRAKVRKLTDKPDKDPTKLPRAEKDEQLAKAAYDQLNEQLTNEIPQLIDLRVPYLDPSFEALVKIQLRFCAEAYSRMAQVQQYLDADVRDQYASGQLDSRVEEVLQEIRELSIAGTV